jgi:hypothetical protein
MVTQEEMEDLYGPLAAHQEHNPGARITYRLTGSRLTTWHTVCQPLLASPLGLP